MGDGMASINEASLAPLVSLVDRLREEVTELQESWEALGEELEAKRQRLRLAEATVELMQRQEEETATEEQAEPAGGGLPRALGEEHVSHADQASVGCQISPSEARS
jgi:vacuolar-type H+-ATPase subunit I/STV1